MSSPSLPPPRPRTLSTASNPLLSLPSPSFSLPLPQTQIQPIQTPTSYPLSLPFSLPTPTAFSPPAYPTPNTYNNLLQSSVYPPPPLPLPVVQVQQQQHQQQLSQVGGAGGGTKEIGIDDLRREVGNAIGLLNRAEDVMKEIIELEGKIFAQESPTLRLRALYTEYETLISTITSSSQTHLFGALPINPPSKDAESIAKLLEETASTEFNRREAIRRQCKSVVDILKGASIS